MTHFPTCLGCVRAPEACESFARLKEAIAGLGVTTIKWRCADRAAAYVPGSPVMVMTYSWSERDPDEPDSLRFALRPYPGVFIKKAGTKGVCFIKPGELSADDYEFPFVPKASVTGKGFIKARLALISPREGAAIDVALCETCGAIPALQGGCKQNIAFYRKRCSHYKPVTFLGGAIELNAGEWVEQDDADDMPF